MSFKNYLNEMPQAVKGDWNVPNSFTSMSKLVLNKYWKKVDVVNKLDLYHHKSSNSWVLGEFNTVDGESKERFVVYFRIEFSKEKELAKKFNLKKLFNVDGVFCTRRISW